MRLFFLVCAVLLVCTSACMAADYTAFGDVAAEFDARAHLEIGGSSGERFITSGPDYDRVQNMAKKLGCQFPVFLVADDSFNAAASTSRIYVNIGALRSCKSDNLLAPILAHEIIHASSGHLRNQYDKQVSVAKQVDSAIKSVNKPGYEENAKIMAKIGNVVISLSSLHYSRVDEYEADIEGFMLAKKAGYNIEEGLGIFDLMGKGPKGILGNLSSHPAPASRKAKVAEAIEKIKTDEKAVKIIKEAAQGIKIVDSPDFAKIVRDRSFTGYAHRMLTKGECLYLLCEGKGELQYNKKKSAVILPAGTKEVFIVAVNPKPANFMGNLRIAVMKSILENSEIYMTRTTDLHLDSLVVKVPVEVLQPGQQYNIRLSLGNGPVLEGAQFDSAGMTYRDCTIGFEKDPADQNQDRVNQMKEILKQKPIRAGKADFFLDIERGKYKYVTGVASFEKDLFYVYMSCADKLVVKRNVIHVPQDVEDRIEIIFCNKENSVNGMDVEFSSKPALEKPIKLIGDPGGVKGLSITFPFEFLLLTDEVTLKTRFWKDGEGKEAEEKQITLKFMR